MPPQIDIPVSVDLQRALDLPECDVLRLPQPDPLQIRLPTGGTIHALQDMSKGVPTDCALSFSLMLQLAPFLAAIDCPLKILKLLEPLAEIIGGLSKVPPSPPSPEILGKFTKAVSDLAPCFLVLTGAPLVPFICDLLNLVSKIMHCLVGQLQTVVSLASGLSLQIQAAADNPDLLAQLQCAQENANAAAGSLANAIEPISAVLSLASPLFALAGIEPITLTPPGGEAAADALEPVIQTLNDVLTTIDDVRKTLCP
jgi:hypothetical protein